MTEYENLLNSVRKIDFETNKNPVYIIEINVDITLIHFTIMCSVAHSTEMAILQIIPPSSCSGKSFSEDSKCMYRSYRS